MDEQSRNSGASMRRSASHNDSTARSALFSAAKNQLLAQSITVNSLLLTSAPEAAGSMLMFFSFPINCDARGSSENENRDNTANDTQQVHMQGRKHSRYNRGVVLYDDVITHKNNITRR